jgi:hypothetical protein
MKAVKLFVILFVSAALLISACAPTTTPAMQTVEVMKTVKVEKTVEVQPYTQPAPAGSRVPRVPLIPENKPSLKINESFGKPAVYSIAFVFPDGRIALRLAALEAPLKEDSGMYDVAVVEPATGATQFQTNYSSFLISLDLEKEASEVMGRLVSVDGNFTRDISFSRTKLELNQERRSYSDNLPGPPAISVAIKADSICLTVEFPEKSGTFWRYCSLPEKDRSLSVKDNFGNQYESQSIIDINKTRGVLKSAQYLQDQVINTDMTVSEMEDPRYFKDCNDSNKCGADITGAPNASFWDNYASAKDNAGGDDFSAIAGVLHVYHTLHFSNGNLAPGDYVVNYWYDKDGKDLGATVSGIAESGSKIIDQQIPAVPSLFIDPEKPQWDIIAQISGLKFLGKCCLWQNNCP